MIFYKFMFISIISGTISGVLMWITVIMALTFLPIFLGYIVSILGAPVVMFTAAIQIHKRYKRDLTKHTLTGFVLLSFFCMINGVCGYYYGSGGWIDALSLREFFFMYSVMNLAVAVVCYFISRLLLKKQLIL